MAKIVLNVIRNVVVIGILSILGAGLFEVTKGQTKNAIKEVMMGINGIRNAGK